MWKESKVVFALFNSYQLSSPRGFTIFVVVVIVISTSMTVIDNDVFLSDTDFDSLKLISEYTLGTLF